MKKSTVSLADERMNELRDEPAGGGGSALPAKSDGSLESVRSSGLARGETAFAETHNEGEQVRTGK